MSLVGKRFTGIMYGGRRAFSFICDEVRYQVCPNCGLVETFDRLVDIRQQLESPFTDLMCEDCTKRFMKHPPEGDEMTLI